MIITILPINSQNGHSRSVYVNSTKHLVVTISDSEKTSKCMTRTEEEDGLLSILYTTGTIFLYT